MKIGAVILCRYNSRRLPGKALMLLNGKTVIETIVERLMLVLDLEDIVIATSVEDTDNPIVDYAHNKGFNIYRGSLENVAERFYLAAKKQDWDYAIRINGDNVFVDIKLLQQMIDVAKKNNYDFLSNVKDRTYPKGMSVEIVNLNYYCSILENINKSESYKEHVTLYLYENETLEHYYFYNFDLPEASGIQLALDTNEDFERTKKIMCKFAENHTKYNLNEIFEIYKSLEENEAI